MLGMLRRLAREPLLHFLAIGGICFIVLGRGTPTPAQGEIIVSKEDVARIAAGFASTWQRLPSADELKGAVADDIREEVLYRVGIELGLDRDDTIVRRRIGQKMEFFLEGTVEAPTENDLRQFLDRNPDKFRRDPCIAFRQVFVSSKRENARHGAEALLAKLVNEEPDAPSLGDAILLPEAFHLSPVRELVSQFGAEFAEALSAAKPGTWFGPIESAFGYHLVLVTAQEPARLPDLDELRAAVKREWYAQARKSVLDAKYSEMRSRYVVHIDDGALGP
jgi:hypothetical protein